MIKHGFCCKIYHKSAPFSISHTDAHDRLDDLSIHHKPHFPQLTSVFKPSHNPGVHEGGALASEWCTSMLQRLGETKRLWRASRKTRKTLRFSGHCSLGSIPQLKLSFLFGFVLCRMFTSPHPLRRRVGKQTPAAAELQLLEDLLGSAMSRNCLGTCVSRNLPHLARILVYFFQPVIPKDLAVAQHFEDRCAGR